MALLDTPAFLHLNLLQLFESHSLHMTPDAQGNVLTHRSREPRAWKAAVSLFRVRQRLGSHSESLWGPLVAGAALALGRNRVSSNLEVKLV